MKQLPTFSAFNSSELHFSKTDDGKELGHIINSGEKVVRIASLIFIVYLLNAVCDYFGSNYYHGFTII